MIFPPVALRTAALLCVTLVACVGAAAHAQPLDFGDDAGEWANDGECDDPRFTGEGSATTLLPEDRGHDATDCRALYDAGRIALRSDSSADDVDFGDDESEWSNDGECDDPRFGGPGSAGTLLDADRFHDATDCRALFGQGRIALAGTGEPDGWRVERGWLEMGDDMLDSGEYADVYRFTGERGHRALVDVRSGDFDPYLVVRTPSGEQLDNDDYDGDAGRSLLALNLEEDGVYEVTVTSYREGETGGYTVAIAVEGHEPRAQRLDEHGTLAAGDDTLTSGEYVDSFDLEGWPGQHVTIDVRSADFDTYVILKSPTGEQVENDDAEGDDDNGHSRIDDELTELGLYRVLVTSYEPGSTGDYHLTIDSTSAADQPAPRRRDVTPLTVGNPRDGRLENGDPLLDGGEFRDLYVFDGSAGETIRIELASSEFDPYLALVTPAEESIENDDYEGDTERSVIELTLPQDGRYRVMATSYAAKESGAYRLSLTAAGAAAPVARRSTGRIHGVFLGIGDYPGDDSDLRYTAEDATRIRDALRNGAGMRAEDAITLVDSDATARNLRSAMRDIADRIRPEDTFVLFFSGHGNRVPRAAGPETADPDGMDETIELYDGPLRDDELRDWFDGLEARTALIMLDSCFSGGFAKDLISAPGRMGIFSSEEDVTSQVADKFRAGGFLSAFLDEAIGDGLADDDRDGAVTALELSQFVHQRYRSDVKAGSGSFVRTQGPQLGYQHLVIDRGSIGPFDVLFER